MPSASYVVVGVGIGLFLSIARQRSWYSAVRGVLGVVTIGAAFIVAVALTPQFLDATAWHNRSPWRETILFGTMLAGMACRSLAEAIEARRSQIAATARAGRRPPLRVDWWEFAYPFLVSAITFAPVVESPIAQKIGFGAIAFSFQNGFFWQTILKRSAPR